MTFEPRPIRRIVLGENPDGQSCVISDAEVMPLRRIDEKFLSTHLWLTDRSPADLRQTGDLREMVTGTVPPAGGSRIGVLDIAPGNQRYPLHKTDTVDYLICLEGEVDIELADRTVTLRQGDCAVQSGADHRWVNRGKKPARIVFVMIDAEPKRPGSLGSGEQAR